MYLKSNLPKFINHVGIKRLIAFLLMCSLQVCYSSAQTYIDISGKVIDAVDGTPLAFAHVTILNGSVGTTTNTDGFFRLRLPDWFKNDSLKISYLGYQSKRLSVISLSKAENLISLSPEGINLQEIVVRPDSLDAVQIVEAMREQLRKNYPQKPKNITGFFRETINLSTKVKQEILYAEGVLEFYKTAYRGKPDIHDAVRVVKGYRKPLLHGYRYRKDTLSLPSISQGSHLGIMVDIAKAPPDFLGPRFWKRYQYQHLGYTNLDTFNLHIISFKPLANQKKGGLEGKLYIDAKSLALVKASFIMTKQALNEYNEYHTKEKELPINLISRKLEVNYSNHDGSWYLKSGHVLNRYVDVRTNVPFINKMDVIVTEIKPGKGKHLPPRESLHRESVFAIQAGKLSADYWEGFNVIANTPLKPISRQPTPKPYQKQELITLEGADWINSLEVAKRLAKREKKLILIDFWATWCRPCFRMDQEVWSTPEIQALKENFIPLEVDIDLHPSIRQALNVRYLPTVMIIDPWEDVYLLEEGYQNKEHLKALLEVFPANVERLYIAMEDYKSRKEDAERLMEVIRNQHLYASNLSGSAKRGFVQKSLKHLKKLRKMMTKEKSPQLQAELSWQDIWSTSLRGQKSKALSLLEEAVQGEIQAAHQTLAYFLATHIYREAGKMDQAHAYLEKLKQCNNHQPYLVMLTN
ncbi:MAG: thioredoxin family protein [Saprospiraceae bacterium]|nr:thioredoxin family protein [Saprospiraceae bacterium]